MKKEEPQVPRCCVPDCNKEARWRGVCQSCYGQAKRLIDDGKTTWTELEEMGLAVPDVKNKPLLKAFLAKKEPPEPTPPILHMPDAAAT